MKRTGAYALSAAVIGSAIPLGFVGQQTAQAATRTYYVSPSGSDSNRGTSAATPFRSLQKAADTAAPGDTVSIMSGTYRQKSNAADVLLISRSGRAGAPITFQAYPGQHPIINPVGAWNGIRVNGASHIIIRGLEIKGDSANISLRDAERGASTKNGKYNTNCLSIDKNKASGATPHHIDILNNTVHHCPGGGIGASDVDHLTIDRNHVYSNAWYSVFGNSGISILTARDSDAGDPRKYKIRITNNTAHDNETKVKWEGCRCYSDGNGIIVDTLKGHNYQGRVLVANNVSYDNGGSGIHSYKSQHVDIVNNTAYQNGRSTRMNSYANIFAVDSKDVRLLNNVSYGRPGQATNSKSRNVDVTYDYNVYFGGKAPEVKGPHDLITDPKIVKPGTRTAKPVFSLQKDSPAVGSAAALSEVKTDITGARRDADTPDRGAFAFTTIGKAPRTSSAPPTGDSAAKDNNSDHDPGADATEQNAVPSGTASTDATSNVRANGNSTDLATTGASVALPLGVAAAALGLGGGIIFLLRRKRS
ncbi:right-handed parallel beta-helix repeat-containing protein [Streptomyces sp. NBC_00687]|uniref:right-handed parallel beta-helix repeat-containing protein n=1 Tax=Streptomyces sp. NBC_00687 TaxID=2975807 RepID=UPI0022598A67|nr:right-handed parallel beta-helix repeat-containing protein [Streptomyces sp. NBC_00687]MCX4918904.1 right-handed parallel beta-helix repeat-containing protein [Streptomyces sp. NBC_00687]